MAEGEGTTVLTGQGNTAGDGGTGDGQGAQGGQDGAKGADGQGDNNNAGQGDAGTGGQDGAGQGGDGGGEGGDKGGDGGDPGAPENYADFTMPEGFEMDQAALDSFTPLAKELGLSQENAQKLVDVYANLQKAEADKLAEVRTGWLDQVKADKEIGGAQMNERVAVAASALEKYGTPEFRSLLDQSGLGDHPEVVRFCFKVGKAMAEDTLHAGGGDGGGQTKSQADIMNLSEADPE